MDLSIYINVTLSLYYHYNPPPLPRMQTISRQCSSFFLFQTKSGDQTICLTNHDQSVGAGRPQ